MLKESQVAAETATQREGFTMKANVKETASDFEQEINALLATIPPQLEYQEWFRVAAALKNCGAEFTVFDNWSQRAPEKYSREETERV